MNSNIKEIIKQKLDGAVEARKLKPGSLAAYMADFESQKHDIDFHDSLDEGIELWLKGVKASRTVGLWVDASELDQVFHASFDEGLELVRATNRRVLELGKSFGVLYAGGSPENTGLRRILDEDMSELQNEATVRGIKVAYAFLREKEAHS